MHILLFLYTGAVVLVNFVCWVYTVNSSIIAHKQIKSLIVIFKDFGCIRVAVFYGQKSGGDGD